LHGIDISLIEIHGKAGLTPAFLFSEQKNLENPKNVPDFVNPVTRYCRSQFIPSD
jgi:hypothetical protein